VKFSISPQEIYRFNVRPIKISELQLKKIVKVMKKNTRTQTVKTILTIEAGPEIITIPDFKL
jgi:hypothetical protein